MSRPYVPVNGVWSTLASNFVHGTDVSIVLADASKFDSGGGYIEVRSDLKTFPDHYARYQYTGISTNDLTGLTLCTLGNVESEAAFTFTAGMYVFRVLMGEDIDDRVAKAATAPAAGSISFPGIVNGETVLTTKTIAASLAELGYCDGVTSAIQTQLNTKTVVTLGGYAICFQNDTVQASPFTGKINSGGSGGLTATNVPYDGDSGELSIADPGLGGGYAFGGWARIVLHNTTRGNSRKITAIDTTNNKITTESSTDDWADDYDITTQSQTVTRAGYYDLYLGTANIPATATGLLAHLWLKDVAPAADSQRSFFAHPYVAYDDGKRQWVDAMLSGEAGSAFIMIPITSSTITLSQRFSTNNTLCRVYAVGYLT